MDLCEDDIWMFNVCYDICFEEGVLQFWNIIVFGLFVDYLMDNFFKLFDFRMLNVEIVVMIYNYGGCIEGLWQLKNVRLYIGVDLWVEGVFGIWVCEFLMGLNVGWIFEDDVWQDG